MFCCRMSSFDTKAVPQKLAVYFPSGSQRTSMDTENDRSHTKIRTVRDTSVESGF